MKKFLLVGFIVALCFFVAACSASNETTHVATEVPPDLAQPASESAPVLLLTPEQEDFSQAELKPKQIYYEYFSNDFEIIEYESIHGQWRLWGHRTGDEVRLTKQVYIHQIEGFDYPVLILAEFTLDDNGVTSSISEGFLNAYLIKGNALTDDLDKEEFDAIFETAAESDGGGWSGRHENETLESLKVNGERLFFLDFSGDVRTDGSMDAVLDWLKASGS